MLVHCFQIKLEFQVLFSVKGGNKRIWRKSLRARKRTINRLNLKFYPGHRGGRSALSPLCHPTPIFNRWLNLNCYMLALLCFVLDLNRQKLVALGILLGCDYLPQGVSGVGKEIAMKLIKSINHKNLLDRLK